MTIRAGRRSGLQGLYTRERTLGLKTSASGAVCLGESRTQSVILVLSSDRQELGLSDGAGITDVEASSTKCSLDLHGALDELLLGDTFEEPQKF